jgi:malate synthase
MRPTPTRSSRPRRCASSPTCTATSTPSGCGCCDRAARQARFDAGELPDFKPNPIESERPDWRVAPAPADFDDRRVEITGPAEPKMMINALNSGASVFMCDFEDALSPTWDNVVTGHWAVGEAVAGA